MPKIIEAYTHPTPASESQEVDPWVNTHKNWKTHPCYYASVRDGGRTGLLAGPFKSHQEALDILPKAKSLAQKMDPRAAFYSFGTLRLLTGKMEGVLNSRLEVNL